MRIMGLSFFLSKEETNFLKVGIIENFSFKQISNVNTSASSEKKSSKIQLWHISDFWTLLSIECIACAKISSTKER